MHEIIPSSLIPAVMNLSFNESGLSFSVIVLRSANKTPCFTTSSAANDWTGALRRCLCQRQGRHFKDSLPLCPRPVDLLLHPRSTLPVQLPQAASARSNYKVSAPVKEILFVSVTISSSSELRRSSNAALISVNDGKTWGRACEDGRAQSILTPAKQTAC